MSERSTAFLLGLVTIGAAVIFWEGVWRFWSASKLARDPDNTNALALVKLTG